MMAKATTFRVEKGRGGKDFTPAHRKTDSRLDGGNSLHGIFKARLRRVVMATRLFALPLLIQNLQSGEGNSTGHSGGGEANLKLRNFWAFFEAFGLYLSFDAATRG